ncbi:MAG: DUF3098 domain-containing protein [Tannerellaceae bacterium]|jgi:hypothetical protein|nr:DUF3098 domain-containing protein [Tannerellaceae bacterium]
MSKENFAFGKDNFILIIIAVGIIILGFVLMSGGGMPAGDVSFNPDLFSPRRIQIAPLVTMAGFGLMLFGILRNSKDKRNGE